MKPEDLANLSDSEVGAILGQLAQEAEEGLTQIPQDPEYKEVIASGKLGVAVMRAASGRLFKPEVLDELKLKLKDPDHVWKI